MTGRRAPRLALALLARFVADSEPLAGDLLEDFAQRQSTIWLWWQVLVAVVTAPHGQPDEIRPLRLVELQPTDAVERSRRMSLRVHAVNLSASPLSGVGGLGLVVLAFLVTLVQPGAWWVLLTATLLGALLGCVLIVRHARLPVPATTIRPLSIDGR